jgi:hypothetical protein
MNQAQSIPAPYDLVSLLSSSDPEVRNTAVHFLIDHLKAPDPLLRWGTAFYLLHTPMRQYIDILIEKLQEEGQLDKVSPWLTRPGRSRLGLLPATPAYILRVHARLRLILFLNADLHRCVPDDQV